MKTKTILKLIILILIGFIFYSLFINDNITLNENNNNSNPGITEPDTSNNLFIEVSTEEEEMNTLLESGEVGSVYKYTGTTGIYENGALYEIVEESDPLQGTWRFTIGDTATYININMFGTYTLNYGVKYIEDLDDPDTFYVSTDTYNQFDISSGADIRILGSDISLVNSNNDVINLNSYDNLIIGFHTRMTTSSCISAVIQSLYAITYVDLDIYSSLDDVENGDALLAFLQAKATKQVSKQFAKLILKSDLEEITITENGEYSGEYSNITVEVPQPQLYAPTISLNGDILTITPNADNGAFVLSYDLYVDDVLVGNYTGTTIDLSTLELEDGTYTITIVATGINFVDSVASNGVSYVVESDPLQGTWVFNDTLTFDTTSTASTRAMSYEILVSLDFISNGSSYEGFFKLSTGGLKYREDSMSGPTVYDTAVYSGWANENYKTIEITSTYDEIVIMNSTLFSSPEEFLSWLQANATKK